MIKDKTIVVAMSGGVDSSATAAILKEQGAHVLGITLNVWPEEETACARSCCSITDVDDARAVCSKLGIPHYVLNMRDIFYSNVVDYFIQEYLRGRTPNPCIECNSHVKFEALLHKAEELGADYVASGHYARIRRDENSGEYKLMCAADTHKDQTYVLYRLTQEKLKKILMPCGEYTKPEIRKIAERFALPTFQKPDSQDLCFIGREGYAGFIRENCGLLTRPGNIIDKNGKILGRHEGVYNFTIGQHKGLGAYSDEKLYVTGIDAEKAAVYVGHNEDLFAKGCEVENISRIAAGGKWDSRRVQVKIRYNAPAVGAQVFESDNRLRIVFDSPQRAVTPGQAAVLYDGGTVLGGGTIAAAI